MNYLCRAEIIRCLSSVTFEHRVLGTAEDLSKECRKQLKTAYLQQEQVNVSCGVFLFTLVAHFLLLA